jgi:hypothetical protein
MSLPDCCARAASGHAAAAPPSAAALVSIGKQPSIDAELTEGPKH